MFKMVKAIQITQIKELQVVELNENIQNTYLYYSNIVFSKYLIE